MTHRLSCVLAAALLTVLPNTAHAGEVFGGLYVHDVKTPLNLSGIESGADVQLGWRGGRIGKSRFQPYVFGALNTAGETSYAAAGISAMFGDRIFIRPGLGLAIHNGSTDDFMRTDRIAFGSRILFEPELGIGARIGNRATIEASWVHMSHATLFSGQNPGIDNLGVRLSFGL
ncbi:acyloxyacyl hydrolase [Sphingomonas lutea]|uniref:Acyloxyacyl hydrolase n=1 Tax=Sphingomonas lutea TaxID=1045317 RepID=A0A7G9SIW1_9SPHN|nr:acyloxyacyl hydrolase [Sphingomonas lutea]QNN67786.1 acyloxyacyl hydrolase [Sphingomonas lutea]